MCFFGNSIFGKVLYVLFWGVFAYLIFDTLFDIYKKIFNKSDPMLILKQRLAKGEITKKEYDEMKKKLSE